MRAYSTFLFDVGGTLITFDTWQRAQDYAARAHRANVNVSVADAYSALTALDNELNERTQEIQLSLLPAREQRAFWVNFWAEGFRQIGVAESDALQFAAELLDPVNGGSYQQVFADVVPALDALAARGKQLGIVSNFSPNCEPLLKKLGIAHYFDFFVVSGILGIEKPDPRIFKAAVHAAGKEISEIVYVGDSIFHDVEGARGAGMDAILIDRADRFPNFEREFSSRRVRDLREL
jgi:REG-2-like HAD superfamily hydrolase